MLKLPTASARHVEFDLLASEIDHSAWAETPGISINRFWTGDAAPPGSHAEARIIWSPEALIARFVCNQQQPLLISDNPQLDRKTLGLWERDVCEIFIAPSKDQPCSYFEFEAAPTGEWVDLAVRFNGPTRENDFNFSSGMSVATRVSSDSVTIAIRIPWTSQIPMPAMGDEWRVNLFRCVGLGDQRYLAWQPTFTVIPNFHVPEVFGRLRFN